jgi:ABC-type phosphate transport system substrate-binding protein
MAYQGTGGAEGIKRFSEAIYDFAGSDLEIPESDYGNTTDDIQLFPTMAG